MEKKPILGWAESFHGNSKLLTPFTLLLRWLPSLTPVSSLSMLLGMCSVAALQQREIRRIFNIRLNAVVQLKLYRVRGHTHAVIFFATQRNIRIDRFIREHAACFQELAVQVQRVQRFFQRTRYLWDLFRFFRRQVIQVLSMASPG